MRLRAALLVLLMLLGTAAPVAGDLQEELEEVGGQISRLRVHIEAAQTTRTDLGNQITQTDARMRSLVADLEQAEADLVAVADQIADREANLVRIRSDLEARYASLDDTRRTLEATKRRVIDQAVALYMAGGRDLGSAVLALDEVIHLTLSLDYASRAAEATEQIAQDLDALELEQERLAGAVADQEDVVEEEVARLRVQRERLEELAEQVTERKQRVEAELSLQRTLLATVEREIEHFESELAGLEVEQERIKALIRAAQSQGGDAPGLLLRPVPGSITSFYGPRVHPILGITRLHTGIDLSAGYGQAVAAAGDGVVILASWFGGYGNTVVIDHGGGMSTLYAHQSQIGVSNGQTVTAGQTVGYVGSTGLSTGPHLHFEVRLQGGPVNPMPYL